MNRRNFFSRLVGAVAATAVAPSVLDAVGPVIEAPSSLPTEFVGYHNAREFSYLAIGDGGMAKAGVFTQPLGTGTQRVSGIGFQPTGVIFYPPTPGASITLHDSDGLTLDWVQVDA